MKKNLPINLPFFDESYLKRRNEIALLLDGSIDIEYSKEEEDVWTAVCSTLLPLYSKKACFEYLKALRESKISAAKIPQFSFINKVLSINNFKLIPVVGLIDSKEFLVGLKNSEMQCTRYIRNKNSLNYTPEPDIIHEIMGHAVFFKSHLYCILNRVFGEAASKANRDQMKIIERLYWYTIEFGICTEDDQKKAFGAGLLSSIQELCNFEKLDLLPYDLEEISRDSFDTTNPHTKLYYFDKNFEEAAMIIVEDLAKIISD
jgi:phenylalanine-4-hydroxylase